MEHIISSDTLAVTPLFGNTLLLPSLLPSFLPSVSRYGIGFQGDGLRTNRTNRPYLSSPKNVGESDTLRSLLLIDKARGKDKTYT
jgi:hypothetical protein